MKPHTYLVIYRPGPAWLPGQPVSRQPLQNHGRFLLHLYGNGVLISAGPFSDDTGGAAVILAPDLTRATAVVSRDPAVQTGVLEYDLHPWMPVPWAQHLGHLQREQDDRRPDQ